jgi:hypothetical protein
MGADFAPIPFGMSFKGSLPQCPAELTFLRANAKAQL